MAFFQHITTRFDGDPSYVSGVSGLALSGGAGQGSGAGQLFSINGTQGGILGRDLAQTMAVTQMLAPPQAPAPAGRGAVAGLQVTTLGGRAALFSYGEAPGGRAIGWTAAALSAAVSACRSAMPTPCSRCKRWPWQAAATCCLSAACKILASVAGSTCPAAR